MADFCYQCSLDMYFGPPGDLNGLCKEGDIARVLCEGCGITKVDHRGWCISPYCDARHGEPPPGQLEVLERAWRWYERRKGPLGWFLRLRDRLFGSPWDPGYIHMPGTKIWWIRNFLTALYEGRPITRLLDDDDLAFFSEGFTEYGSLTDGSVVQTENSEGTETTGGNDQIPTDPRVLRDEDERPVQGGEARSQDWPS